MAILKDPLTLGDFSVLNPLMENRITLNGVKKYTKCIFVHYIT